MLRRFPSTVMKTILVPIDFSDVTPLVLSTSRSLAAAFGSRVILLNVIEPEPDLVGFDPAFAGVPPVIVRDYQAEQKKLEDLLLPYLAAGCAATALHLNGPVVPIIIEVAKREAADLIVIGSHGHGALFELLVGSVTHGILKHGPCPVLVVPAKKRG